MMGKKGNDSRISLKSRHKRQSSHQPAHPVGTAEAHRRKWVRVPASNPVPSLCQSRPPPADRRPNLSRFISSAHSKWIPILASNGPKLWERFGASEKKAP